MEDLIIISLSYVVSVSIVRILFIVAIVLTGDNGGGWPCKHRKSGPVLSRGLTQASDNHPGRGEQRRDNKPRQHGPGSNTSLIKYLGPLPILVRLVLSAAPQAEFAHRCECDRWPHDGGCLTPLCSPWPCYHAAHLPSLVVTQLVTTLRSHWSPDAPS